MIEKAAGFAYELARHVAAGLPKLKDHKVFTRLMVCESCDRYHDRTCGICGCNMRIKASWAEQKCPLGKWPGEREQHHELVEQAHGHDQESR